MTMTETSLRFDREEYLHPPKGGHAACPGCGAILAMRYFLKALGKNVVLLIPPGCGSVIVHNPECSIEYHGATIREMTTPFGSAAIFAAGLNAGLTARGETDQTVVAWAGDGATFDIGLGLLSGCAERNDDIIYVCYDNEGYMNTGNQRSSATPMGATTTTNPSCKPKVAPKKDILWIMMGHKIPYAATATIAYPDDLMRKVQKARGIKGFRFFHFLTPCVPGWKYPSRLTIELSRLAVATKAFPLLEIEDGLRITLNKEPKETSLEEYLKHQGRFNQLTADQIGELKKQIDQRWAHLKYLSAQSF